MSYTENLIKELKVQKRDIGQIIDDRSANGIPFDAYAAEYKEIERLIELCIAELENRNLTKPCNIGDIVYAAIIPEIRVAKCICENISQIPYGAYAMCRCTDTGMPYSLFFDQFGISAFMTKEKAIEKLLEEKQ
jgi:hypothetical protein